MRLPVRVASAFLLAAASALVVSCGSDAAGRGGGSSAAAGGAPSGATWEDGDPVKGDVTVAWQNLDPNYPSVRVGLVNESSEIGRKLKSGKATSSEIRVLTDVEMGGLLTQLGKLGFFQYATDGLGLDNAPDTPGRRGIVVVTQDGRSKGIMLTLNMGVSPVPKAYVDSKNVINAIHSQLPGSDVKASIGAPDERVFDAPPMPPMRMKRP